VAGSAKNHRGCDARDCALCSVRTLLGWITLGTEGFGEYSTYAVITCAVGAVLRLQGIYGQGQAQHPAIFAQTSGVYGES